MKYFAILTLQYMSGSRVATTYVRGEFPGPVSGVSRVDIYEQMLDLIVEKNGPMWREAVPVFFSVEPLVIAA